MDSVADLFTHAHTVVRANAMICFSTLSKHHANFNQLTDPNAVCEKLKLLIENSELSDEDRLFLLEITPIISGQPTTAVAITPLLNSGGHASTHASAQMNSQMPEQ
jgi:hypothetical protein